jgi:hypothetical protein
MLIGQYHICAPFHGQVCWYSFPCWNERPEGVYYDECAAAPPPVGQVEVLEEQRGSGAGLVFEGSQLTFRNFRGFRGIPQGDRGGSTENQVFLNNQTPEPP